jgi:hypothetical protein
MVAFRAPTAPIIVDAIVDAIDRSTMPTVA